MTVSDGPSKSLVRSAQRQVDKIAKQLGVDWQVTVVSEWAESEDVFATTSLHCNTRSAIVFLCEGWDRLPEQFRHVTLVHEVLHVAQAEVTDFVCNRMLPLIEDDQLAGLVNDVFTDLVERYTEDMAQAVYGLLPPF